ncbi:MAG: YkgJ family cysteine cluster protein [Desulfovibrionaceae bacterium]
MRAPVGVRVADAFVSGPTLSGVEKFLLKRGWSVQDRSDPRSGAVESIATDPASGESVLYPHPAYHYDGQDRDADMRRMVAEAAPVLGMDPDLLALQAANVLLLPHPGFTCRSCGHCCTRFRDAYQGRVTVEEVAAWERLGLTRITRFVQRVERRGYALYQAWVHPKTGEYLARCPWLARTRDGRALCRIHPVRPYKCRSFPLFAEQAERIGCKGFEPLPVNPAPGMLPDRDAHTRDQEPECC